MRGIPGAGFMDLVRHRPPWRGIGNLRCTECSRCWARPCVHCANCHQTFEGSVCFDRHNPQGQCTRSKRAGR